MQQLPEPLLQTLRSINGFDEAPFIAAHQQGGVTSVRMHPLKGAGSDISEKATPWCNSGFYLKERPVFTLDPAYHGGAYYVQEASSMFLHHLWKTVVPQDAPLRVLDLCAAPGGKSTLIASILNNDSLLISNEVIRTRASILEENMNRWGYANTWVTCNDPRDFTQLTGYFDVIVIDAPCSGSGLFRKDHKALTDWTEANVSLCSGRQQRILADVWPALKQGGILIYATCSFSPQEDEAILDWLADEYAVTTLDAKPVADWGIVTTNSPEHEMIGYRFFPDKLQGEGFFIAAVQKNDASAILRTARFKPENRSKIQEQARHLLADKPWQYIPVGKENYCAINAAHEPDWQLLQKLLYFRKAGVSIGSPTAKEWIPAHDIALSIDAAPDLPHLHLNREQALKFLKKEDFGLDETGKGWKMIKFNNLGLGWVKSLGNRMNNYLPKHWRIRMEIPDDDIA